MTQAFQVLAAAVSAVALASAAEAQAPRQHYSLDGQHILGELSVPVADLDPASAEGARILLQRIEAAADRVCGGDPKAPTYRDCRDAAVAQAVARMKSPALAGLAADRHKAVAAAW